MAKAKPGGKARIVAATPRHAKTLASMRYDFRTDLAKATETKRAFVARCARWIRSRLKRPGPWKAWIALHDQQLVGCAWLHVVEKMPNPVEEAEIHAYLTNFYVLPEHRGKGVGELLLRAAIDWCAAHEIDYAFLWTSQAARPFYHRNGFREDGDVLVRPITRRGPRRQ